LPIVQKWYETLYQPLRATADSFSAAEAPEE
jgi:hypothetical protein